MDSKYNALAEAILDGDEELGVEEAQKLIASGCSPADIFVECIQDTLNALGDRFGRLEVFLPDLIMASDVVKAIQEDLSPLIAQSGGSISSGKVVIGTAFGDLHDIGKNMVSLMLEVNGFEVKDLGVNVPVEQFISAAQEMKADIIGISGLMLPSLPYMQDTIDRAKANSAMANVKIMVGGGPVTQEWATSAGADGYSDDAMGAVTLAKQLMTS